MRSRSLGLVCWLSFLAAALGAAPPEERPDLQAVELTEAPVLDGRVLDDPAWSAAPVATGLWQVEPEEGVPASERTEVRIGFDAQFLYVAVVCYDAEPDRLVIGDTRRDSRLNESDSIRLTRRCSRPGPLSCWMQPRS